MISLTIKKPTERLLWFGLIFCTVCESYRYPLQISDSGTSPTYADTPLVFQITKLAIMFVVSVLSLFFVVEKRLPFQKWALAVVTLGMSGYVMVKALVGAPADMAAHVQAAYWPVVTLIIVLATSPVSVRAVDQFFRFVLISAIISNVIEILLFVTVGRLPAHAYRDSLLVRFGGFLDDPNAFAALLYMLMGWAFYRYSGARRFLILSVLVVCILLTQCLTAIAFLLPVALIVAFNAFVRRPRPLKLAAVIIVAGIILSAAWASLVELVSGILETKAGSAAVHISQLSEPLQFTWIESIIGGFSYRNFESWWVGSLFNYGIPWFLLTLGLVLWLTLNVFMAYWRERDESSRAILAGILMLSLYLLVGDLNLPYFKIFPVNFFFFFFTFLVYFDRIRRPQAVSVKMYSLPGSIPSASTNP